jgi:hypothetical protein
MGFSEMKLKNNLVSYCAMSKQVGDRSIEITHVNSFLLMVKGRGRTRSINRTISVMRRTKT